VIRDGERIVAGLAAIADASAGGVIVHCASGKDRTGMTVALALRVAGKDDAIAADYAYTAVCLHEEHERALAAAPDDAERERLADLRGRRPATILGMLARIDDEFGGIETYLLHHGMIDVQIDRLRTRLRKRQALRAAGFRRVGSQLSHLNHDSGQMSIMGRCPSGGPSRW
jgi:hypothetical protein